MFPARRLFPPVFLRELHHAASGPKGADVPAGPDAVTGVRRAAAPLNRPRLGRQAR